MDLRLVQLLTNQQDYVLTRVTTSMLLTPATTALEK